MKILSLVFLMLVFSACNQSSVSGTSVPFIDSQWLPVKTICGGVEIANPRIFILGGNTYFDIYETVNSGCSIRSTGTYTYDKTSTVLTLNETSVTYEPSGCDLAPLRTVYTKTGPTELGLYAMGWNYVNNLSQACTATFSRHF